LSPAPPTDRGLASAPEPEPGAAGSGGTPSQAANEAKAGAAGATQAGPVRVDVAGMTGGNSQPTEGAVGGGGVAGMGSSGSSGAAGGSAMMATESEAPATCEKGKIKASEVVFIGESFIAAGTIPSKLSGLARAAGAIAMSESYQSFAVSGTQLTTGEIPMQYDQAKAESPVKVVLMDGGGNDLLWGGQCKDGPESCAQVLMVVQTLFQQMAADGVKDVVYFFYPDPMGIGASIKEAQDTLRPEMKELCDSATDVRCVWVDQRESWEGHYDTYTEDGIHPTEAGSEASAKQIWDAMVASCVAQ
jgi:lysophospholipase L1-like esterase